MYLGQPIVRRMARAAKRLTSSDFQTGILMKKIITAAALLMISASAHAGVYNVEGVTIRVQDGCTSSACVSVDAPGYGAYRGGRTVKLHKTRKDTTRIASVKKDDAAATPAATAAPSAETTPANNPEKNLERGPDAAPQAAPADTAPVK
jgi:hypothetical protein